MDIVALQAIGLDHFALLESYTLLWETLRLILTASIDIAKKNAKNKIKYFFILLLISEYYYFLQIYIYFANL